MPKAENEDWGDWEETSVAPNHNKVEQMHNKYTSKAQNHKVQVNLISFASEQ